MTVAGTDNTGCLVAEVQTGPGITEGYTGSCISPAQVLSPTAGVGWVCELSPIA